MPIRIPNRLIQKKLWRIVGFISITQSLRRRVGEDEYKWRKYEEKQVDRNENQTSYYKCTIPNCHVKKKVERTIDGKVIGILYNVRQTSYLLKMEASRVQWHHIYGLRLKSVTHFQQSNIHLLLLSILKNKPQIKVVVNKNSQQRHSNS
ncbi:unnamed protein product [Lupinus luteus]|uniref:WRKY domain-containing protein n=1 Tax=Lupinus luteus TaxID=3873 RepID=A0AAV1WGM8_LUPLU